MEARTLSLPARLLVLRRWLGRRTSARVGILAAFFLAYGTCGYTVFEAPADLQAETILDGLWWSVVTMMTVGYGDVSPVSTAGRLLVAVPVMVAGTGVLAYGLSMTAAWLIEDQDKRIHGMKALRLDDHIVLINDPGHAKLLDVVGELRSDSRNRGRNIVLLTDALDELPADVADLGVAFVQGSPINEGALERACVAAAAQILVLAGHGVDENADSTNLGIVIGLRATGTRARIVVEAVAERHKPLLARAGADLIVCVTALSSTFLAQAAQGESMQDLVMGLTSNRADQQVDIVPLELRGEATFGEVAASLLARSIVLLGCVRAGTQHINPGSSFAMSAGDGLLIVSASRPQLVRHPAEARAGDTG